MRPWVLDLLQCPATGTALVLCEAEFDESGDILTGRLRNADGSRSYEIRGGVPRFVESHYASAFGLQWNRHRDTQLDRGQRGHSAFRFWGETGFQPECLRDKLVLDGGCGSGRFTAIAARAGGRVVAVDLSEAVDACYSNFRHLENVTVLQASLFELPLKPATFDFVFTIGVIQHTPDPLRALRCIAEMAKFDGGEAGVSWYKRYWYTFLHQKYWLRPLFRGWTDERLYRFISWYVPKLLPLSRALCRLPYGAALNDRVLPVANRDFVDGLSEQERLEWAILDTYDWYNPRYDKPQRWADVEDVMRRAGYCCDRAPLERRGLHCVRRSPAEFTKQGGGRPAV